MINAVSVGGLGPMIRVLICDGIGLRSSLIAALLSHEPDMRVIGSANTVHDTLKCMPDCDVLPVGNSLPRTEALEVAIAAASTAPYAKTIAVGYRGLEPLLTELMQAGAIGYVLQDASVAD